MAVDRTGSPSRYAGKEIFDVKPAILGGDPTDPSNKVVLDRDSHIRAVRYWNRLIRQLREQQKGR